ncbi:alpha-N-arabinofuranosidase [Pelagicoccus albus]|uniref:non-reducing end alpha-L-arabinofuranosidase n=1 Tax=Pelagicoccus albus TaxID=415222 RepID=A0A7X1B3M7_9BACT|nr:alpha-L-arabinofuranosidase C-terminal domain-containing protein [Pelagicoccus albus]MBC2605033.1 alpha-L-arabinofuranosidase [Pelagicoccus albus]
MPYKSRIKIETTATSQIVSPELHGQFIEHLGGCIQGGIWVGSDSEIDNKEGLRTALLNAFSDLEPPVLRWPGGCFADTYHWRDGIGDPNRRPTTYNATFGTNQPENNEFGTHEFIDFCRRINAEPWINTNLLSGSVEEMVSWAEYCNRPSDTYLAKERATNGSSTPFNVTYWGIGNEAWAGGGTFTAEGYADTYRRYASAFPRFPIEPAQNQLFPETLPIKLVAVGPDGNKPQERVEWTRRFFDALGEFRAPPIHGYDLHFYNWNLQGEAGTITDFNEDQWNYLLDGALELEEVIEEQHALIEKHLPQAGNDPFAYQPNVDLIVGEWGNWHPFDTSKTALWQQNTVRDMVCYALTLDIFHRHCDKVKMACLAQSVNVLGALAITDGPHTILTPTYHLFQLYKAHRGAQKLETSCRSTTLFERTSTLKAVHSFASLKDGVVTINIVNASMSQPNEVSLVIDTKGNWEECKQLASDQPWHFNDAKHPDRVSPRDCSRPSRSANNAWLFLAPPASVSVLRYRISP